MQEQPSTTARATASETDLAALRAAADRIREEIGRIVVGQREVLDDLLVALFAGGHVLLEGVPGVAKTLVAKLLARTLRLPFSRIQFTPDLMPSDVLGTSVFDPRTTQFDFREGPIFAQLVLIDEINRAPAKTQAALFEVMEERQVTVDGTTRRMDAPFMVVATQNPLEHEGTYRLPEAQLDRFLMKIEVGYPSRADEVAMLTGHLAGRDASHLDLARPVLEASEVARFQAVVDAVHIEPALLEYIAALVQKTRTDPGLVLGASPRAAVARWARPKPLLPSPGAVS